MHHIGTIITGLIQALRRHVMAQAPALAAPARPIHVQGQGWTMPPFAHLPVLPTPVWTLLWFRLQRLQNRITRLYDRWITNTLPTPRKPSTRPASVRPVRPPQQIPNAIPVGTGFVDAPARLPRGHGWVVKRLPQAGPSSGALHDLLQSAHAEEFVRAVPQAARLLRPLCRMLAVDQPAWLKLPPRPRKPRKTRPRPARAARPLPLTHPDLKLRPYEIAAARYWIRRYGREG